MKQYGLNGSYYNEEMSSAKTLDLLPRYIYMSYSTCGGEFEHAMSMLRTAGPAQRTKTPCQTSLQLTRTLVRSSV